MTTRTSSLRALAIEWEQEAEKQKYDHSTIAAVYRLCAKHLGEKLSGLEWALHRDRMLLVGVLAELRAMRDVQQRYLTTVKSFLTGGSAAAAAVCREFCDMFEANTAAINILIDSYEQEIRADG